VFKGSSGFECPWNADSPTMVESVNGAEAFTAWGCGKDVAKFAAGVYSLL
jgi:hypothetical protein